MKKHLYLSFLGLCLFAAACQETNELDEKRQVLSEKKEKVQELKAEISELESEIAALDPAFAKANRQAALVSTRPVTQTDFKHFVEVRGEVSSDKNVVLSAEAMGMVYKVPVEEGRQVSKGQVLVNIQADVLRNNIEEVKTRLELAGTIFERQKNLWEQHIGTEVQFLEAKNRVESLQRQLTTLESQLARSVVRAPFSGTVEEIMVRPGEIASMGMPLLRLVSLEDMYIKAAVPENYIGKLQKGDKVEVTFPSLNRMVETILAAVGQVIDPNNRTFTIEARLPDENELLKPNLLAVLKVKDFEEKNAIVVPTNLIQRDGQGEYVYVVAENGDVPQAKKKHIDTGITYHNQTLVKSGLNAGDVLIDQGFREVVDGMNLRIAGNEEGLAKK